MKSGCMSPFMTKKKTSQSVLHFTKRELRLILDNIIVKSGLNYLLQKWVSAFDFTWIYLDLMSGSRIDLYGFSQHLHFDLMLLKKTRPSIICHGVTFAYL